MTHSTLITRIVCPGCGAVNRVAKDRSPLAAKCGACHQDKQGLQRISGIRKSPEGWDMTIVAFRSPSRTNCSR